MDTTVHGRLLLIDDDPSFCSLVNTLLDAKGYLVTTETDSRTTLDHLRSGAYDAVLLDIVMPHQSGLELILEIREHFELLPILVVTAYDSVDVTWKAMAYGASDFLIKPVDVALLDLRIRRAIELETIHRMARVDGLTGLYNHRYLQQRLQQEIDRAERHDLPLSLVMADIDRFKDWNDAYGHLQGDRALTAVAHAVGGQCRTTDVAARYGGEEFTLVLPETATDEALTMAERTRQRIEALEIRGEDGRLLTPLTLSLGVASHLPGAGKKALIEASDAALYEAKRRGRNRVCAAPSVVAPVSRLRYALQR